MMDHLSQNKNNILNEFLYEKSLGKSNFNEPIFMITEKVNFIDDLWDFTELRLQNHRGYFYVYNFNKIKTNEYRVLLKRLVLRQIISRISFVTIRRGFDLNVNLINFIENEKYIIDPALINKKVLTEFIDKVQVTEKTKRIMLGNIRKFLIELEASVPEIKVEDFFEVLTSYDIRKINRQIELGKTPNIPPIVFNRIMQAALQDIDNKDLPLLDRMISCLILILSQVGMRKSELLILEIDKLREITILKGKKTVHYLKFFSSKTTLSPEGKWVECFMNDIAVKAYKVLKEITEVRRGYGKTALFPNNNGDFYSTGTLSRHFKRFFVRHQNCLGFEELNSEELSWTQKWVIGSQDILHINLLKKDDIGKVFYRINTHQFRVAVANQLKSKGVSLQWIREHMNHLEEEMTKHYFRDDKIMKKALVIRANKEGTQLETDPNKIIDTDVREELSNPYYKKAYDDINTFLKKTKKNIYNNLDDIIKILKDTPIRENEVGFCTKAFGKLCERQERLTTLEKWYYVRPSITDLSSIIFTFKRLEDKFKLVKHNYSVVKKDLKYTNEYKRELTSLTRIYKNKFLPELEMLKEQISKEGIQNIYQRYPSLENFISTSYIEQMEVMNKEVKRWIEKTN